VLAEVDYFLRDERRAMQVFMEDLARGAFTYAPSTVGHLSRAMEVDRRFVGLGLGLVDGSVVALAESLAFVVPQHATGVTSQPFDSAMVARLSWWIVQRILASPDRLVRRLSPNMNHSAFHWWPRSLVRVVM
jgi:hypothetical protein